MSLTLHISLSADRFQAEIDFNTIFTKLMRAIDTVLGHWC